MSQSTALPARPILAFLTDFGTRDGFVAAMKGVALGIVPDAQLVDITHEVPPQHIPTGAWVLSRSYAYFPKGTVFVCVVDPGVGSVRRPVALHVGDWFFVGPDNGLFSTVLEQQPLHEAVALTNAAYHLSQVSSTFHGRDIFTPVGAHIARGVALSELGQRVDPEDVQRLDLARPTRQEGRVHGAIAHVDHFGNLATNIPLSMVPELPASASRLLVFPDHGHVVTEYRQFFSEGPTDDARIPFIYIDSSGYVAIAVRNGNAAQTLQIGYGAPITLVIGEA